MNHTPAGHAEAAASLFAEMMKSLQGMMRMEKMREIMRNSHTADEEDIEATIRLMVETPFVLSWTEGEMMRWHLTTVPSVNNGVVGLDIMPMWSSDYGAWVHGEARLHGDGPLAAEGPSE